MEGAAQIASTIGRLVGEEYRQLRGVGGQVAELRDELATMNAILRMQSEAEDGAVDHFVREWMKQVRELAYDAEDCLDLYIFRIRCRPRDRFLAWSRRLLRTVFPRHQLAGEITALRARVVAISERHARYGVSRDALCHSSAAPVPASSSSARALLRPANDDAGHLVGMEEQVDTLAEKVKLGAANDTRKVFAVVGFGGLGKTTLAMEVCRKLEAEFQRQAHVSVSQTFDVDKDLEGLIKRVLQQIVKVKSDNEEGIQEEESLTQGDIDKMNLGKLAETLENKLTNKRYLIVIDDVWTIAAWNAIQSRLPENNSGSRIMVTTRIETVAKACSHASVSGQYIHRMKPLKTKDAEMLFLSRAFGSKDATCPTDLKGQMDNIISKCGGLPLAIISIGSLLASYNSSDQSKAMWERICRSIGTQMDSNPTLEGMRQIITLSYNHLPHHLKACMMYLCIFPEDYVFNKERLLNRWIAEGLVEEKRGLTLMEVAEAYLDELMARSMIDRAADIVTYYERLEMFRVHDIMLEVMVSKSLEANFVSLVGGQYEGMSYDRIRRLSIHGGRQGSIKDDDTAPKKTVERLARRTTKRNNGMMEMNLKHVRSLSTFEELKGNTLLDSLGKITLLRVLDLEDCKGLENYHLTDICGMYLLRFLSLKGTDISEIPQKVGELEHLQTFDVRDTLLEGLPDDVTKLEKLEILQFSNRHNWLTLWYAPYGLYKMKALRVVSRVGITDVQVAREIGDLKQLQEIFVYIGDPCNDKEGVREVLAESLGSLYSLWWLQVGELSCYDCSMDYLIDLPSALLRYLRFSGSFTKFPEWVGSLTNLVEFAISYGHLAGENLFEVLSRAPNLERVLFQMHFYDDYQLVARTGHKFPALKAMTVTSNTEYPKLFQFEEGSMTKLEKLEVNFANNTEKSIVGVEHLKNLKEVRLTGSKNNPALNHAVEQLKDLNDAVPKDNQLVVRVKYD